MVWSRVRGLHRDPRNTVGISSIGPYWNLKSVNPFKESIHFCNFFSSRIFLVSRRLYKKERNLIWLVKVLILPNIMLWWHLRNSTHTVFVNSFIGACTSLLWTYIKLIVIILSSTATVTSRQWLGFSSSNNLDPWLYYAATVCTENMWKWLNVDCVYMYVQISVRCCCRHLTWSMF